MNHPNRSTWRGSLPPLTGDQWREIRGARTQTEFAAAHGLGGQTRVAEFETGAKRAHWALQELILLREGRHPTLQLIARTAETV